MARPPRVYIPNKSHHNFEAARRFGDFVFLTEGIVNRFNVNHMYRQMNDRLQDAEPQDYLMIASLNVLNAVAASILTHKFGRVNFLLYGNGRYEAREIVLDQLEPNGD